MVRELAQSSDAMGDTGDHVEGWPSMARVMPHHPGRQGRLGLPPKAAPAVGRPKGAAAPMHQSREAHH
jgi:hypothetical protein